ncbi:MAG: hypothetical protein PF450_10835 [Bacteroidales bacterium]|nr:hypothetical protein [Bacteroidales bacterium]
MFVDIPAIDYPHPPINWRGRDSGSEVIGRVSDHDGWVEILGPGGNSWSFWIQGYRYIFYPGNKLPV